MTQTIVYILIALNIVTFFVYGIDMKVWHHKTMHLKFFAEQSGKAERKYGLPLILLVQIVLFYLAAISNAL